MSAEPAFVPAAGSELLYKIDVTNKPGTQGAFGVTVEVTLPTGFTVTRTSANRGSGCSAGGPGLVCDLDWISATIPGQILIWGTVSQVTQLELKAFVRELWAEGNWADNTTTLMLTAPAAPPPPPAGGAAGTAFAIAAPRVVGRGVVGATLRLVPPSFTKAPTRIAYQWQLCAASCAPIPRATGPSLKLLRSYAGRSIRLVATATIGGTNVQTSSKRLSVRRR